VQHPGNHEHMLSAVELTSPCLAIAEARLLRALCEDSRAGRLCRVHRSASHRVWLPCSPALQRACGASAGVRIYDWLQWQEACTALEGPPCAAGRTGRCFTKGGGAVRNALRFKVTQTVPLSLLRSYILFSSLRNGSLVSCTIDR